MSTSFLVALLVFLVLAVLLQAKDQSGFISIACGIPAGSNGTDDATGINYISDANFINTGVSRSIKHEFKSDYPELLWNLRSFPEGKRNCYKMNITMGSKYRIRIDFLYGNYDGLNKIPKFGLLLGANWWDNVILSGEDGHGYYEIIHKPSLDYIQICLVDTDFGTPFISTIGLRPLEKDIYVTEHGSLKLYDRVDLGPPDDGYENGYEDDAYDRWWRSSKENDWTQLNVSDSAGPLGQNNYQLPAAVMRTAVRPVDASAPLVMKWSSQDQNDLCYFYMHFMEVADLKNNQTREFNIIVDGKPWYQNLVPEYLSANTISSTSRSKGTNNISLEKTQRSTLPPIINAIEVYILIEFQQSETFQGDVDAITTIKSVYGLTRDWQGDPCGPVDYLWDGLNCTSGNDSPRITTLNLSSSGLAGAIDPSISQLIMLEKLDLSNNSLNGQVPDFLFQLQHLKILNLASNNLIGSVPSVLVEKSKKGFLSLIVDQNPYLCESGHCNEKKKKTKPLVASTTVIGLLIVLVVTAVMFWALKKRKSKEATTFNNNRCSHSKPNRILDSNKQEFTYEEVVSITNNFGRVLGKGGFGTVFHGYLGNTEVAVKMISPSAQAYRQFQAEAELLTKVHHKCLTALIGYCDEGTSVALIYEYMSNGDLSDHLSARSGKVLGWKARLQIAVDTAEGLEYLHYGCEPPIVHRDIKPQNILLNENMRGKLGDFGLSKIFSGEDDTHISTVIAGTRGYLDPEYFMSNKLNGKSDVFSFGIVLLEIITGQPAISKTEERTHIIQWLDSMLREREVDDVVDSRLQGEFCPISVRKALDTAMACVKTTSINRPTMTQVVIELRECLAMEMTRASDNMPNCINDSFSIDIISGESSLAR